MYIVETLFHICIYINIKWNIMKRQVYNILEKDIGMILPKFGNTENNIQSK